MKSIEDYYISYYQMDNNCRHISLTDNQLNYLCSKTWQEQNFGLIFSLKNYILNNEDNIRYIPLCKKCIAKLPAEIREQVVFNLVVTKLKS